MQLQNLSNTENLTCQVLHTDLSVFLPWYVNKSTYEETSWMYFISFNFINPSVDANA